MTNNDSKNQNTVVSPSIKEFLNSLGFVLSTPEIIEVFRTGSPEQKLEKVIIGSDLVLEPEGNWGLINLDLTMKDLMEN